MSHTEKIKEKRDEFKVKHDACTYATSVVHKSHLLGIIKGLDTALNILNGHE